MRRLQTRMIGSAVIGLAAGALVLAGLVFGLPGAEDDADAGLARSARDRSQLLDRVATTGDVRPWAPSDAGRAKAADQTPPAQAAAVAEPAAAEQAAVAAYAEDDDHDEADDRSEPDEHDDGDD